MSADVSLHARLWILVDGLACLHSNVGEKGARLEDLRAPVLRKACAIAAMNADRDATRDSRLA
jgi:hypothetical protein